MNELVYIFIIFIIILSGYMFYKSSYVEVMYVKSSIDNKKHLVRNMPDKKDAADLLATVKLNLISLVQHCYNDNPDDENIKQMKHKFNPDNITESSHKNKYTSYSVNKGERVVFCLRSRDEQENLIDTNTLMFVALHELAHIMTKSIGHTDEFWTNFRYLLKEAVKLNIYTHQDFKNNPKKYCGTIITHTPLDD